MPTRFPKGLIPLVEEHRKGSHGLQVRIQVAESIANSGNMLPAILACLDRDWGTVRPALCLLLGCCQSSDALCEAAAVANIPQASADGKMY